MAKVYDARNEFKPFDRSTTGEGSKRHPNKGKKKKAAPVTAKDTGPLELS